MIYTHNSVYFVYVNIAGVFMANYQLDPWDTKILGFSVAKILPAQLNSEQLGHILQELKSQNVRLVCWASDSQDTVSQQAARQFNGFLADEKVTYLLDLKTVGGVQVRPAEVEMYSETYPNQDLESLAVAIGERSRYGADPKISRQQMETVYKTWIANATKKDIAKIVFVIKRNQKIIGMVTIAEKNSRGDLSLVAVDADYRGQQLGQYLVKAAQLWCIENGYHTSQVVTQKNNIGACKLYEKCGYTIEKIENYYHFWL